MNNKGFTLIELLATIVILSLLSVIVGGSILNYYEASEEKAEEAFVASLKRHIEDYILLNGSKFEYGEGEITEKEKCYSNGEDDVCSKVKFYEAKEPLDIGEISNAISNKEFINPKTNEKCTNSNIEIYVYRDSDYVYCYEAKIKDNTSCIPGSINTCKGIYYEEE